MQKVDVVIAVVGALAIVATTLGVVFYEEIAGEETLEFESVTDKDFYAKEFTGVGSGTQEWSFAVPDNATSATFDVVITFKGNSGQAQNVDVSAYFLDPTGNKSAVDAGRISIPANSQGGGQSVTLTLDRTWATAPEGGNTTDVDAAAAAATTSYEDKLITVYVTIAAVSDPLVGVPGLNINYVYDVAITGDLTRYQRDLPAIPDTTAGQ